MMDAKILSSTGVSSDEYKNIVNTHTTFLKKFKAFPDSTRKVAYKQLLLLPNNYRHLQQLTKPYNLLPQHCQNKQLAIVTDILGKLYPDLQNKWVPGMVHPFVKLFQEDFTFCFEVSLTFLLNWFQPVLLEFPNLNKNVANIFQLSLPNLKQKVEYFEYPLSSLLTPIFVVSLTDLFNRKDWLQIFDFLISNPFEPWHYFSISIALLQMMQESLCKLSSVEQMSILLKKQKNIPVSLIIAQAVSISKKNEQKYHEIYSGCCFPLQPGMYPVYKFFKTPIRRINTNTNNKFQQDEHNVSIQQIKAKYAQVEQLLHRFLNQGQVFDQKTIQNKYHMVQGQLRQYLKLIKQQYSNKINAIREIQNKFNAQLQLQSYNRQHKTTTIQKKARLQKQIQNLMNEADLMRVLQDQMMKRMQETLENKKNQLRGTAQELRRRK